MPYFAGGLLGTCGAGMIQPIYVNDVARAFVEALTIPAASGATYCLGGKDRLTWPQFHHICAARSWEKSGRSRPSPPGPAKAMTFVVPGRILPFNRDQIIMIQEPNICDMEKFMADFGWEPDGLTPTLRSSMRTPSCSRRACPAVLLPRHSTWKQIGGQARRLH